MDGVSGIAVDSPEECEHRVPSSSILRGRELSRKLIRWMMFDTESTPMGPQQAGSVGLQSLPYIVGFHFS